MPFESQELRMAEQAEEVVTESNLSGEEINPKGTAQSYRQQWSRPLLERLCDADPAGIRESIARYRHTVRIATSKLLYFGGTLGIEATVLISCDQKGLEDHR